MRRLAACAATLATSACTSVAISTRVSSAAHRSRWLGLVLVVAACGTPAAPVTLEELAEANARIYCERAFECCATYELEAHLGAELSTDLETCIATARGWFDLQVGGWAASIAAGDTTYDPQRMGACLEKRRTESCEAHSRRRSVWGGCEAVLEGTLPLDAPCSAHRECASGLCRIEYLPGNDLPSSTTCGPMPQQGEACLDEYLCEPGLVCFADVGCQPRRGTGRECFADEECESNHCTTDYRTAGECSSEDVACDGVQPDLSDCDQPLPCAPPEFSGLGSVCGQLVDFATGAPIREANARGAACDAASPSDSGPCSLGIELFILQDLVQQPATAEPIPPEELTIDTCGRFAAIGVPDAPDLPFHLVLVVDDVGPGDRFVRSATSYDDATTRFGLTRPIFLLAHETDAQWAVAAGQSDGAVTDTGALVLRYLRDDVPVRGAEVFDTPGEAFYFDDPAATTAVSLSRTATATGANGAALIVGASSARYCTTCGLLDGCWWPDPQPPNEVPLNTAVFVDRIAKCPEDQ